MGYIALDLTMIATLTILRYRKRFIPLALLSMMLFRFPLWFNKNISFWKLLGSGKNGTFDKHPDWQQWGIMAVGRWPLDPGTVKNNDAGKRQLYKQLYGSFISWWIKTFTHESWTVLLEPIEGHGSWDGKPVFGELPHQTQYEGKIAVLTRATIRLRRLKNFWSHVNGVADRMANSNEFVSSLGIGEMPWIKQATFSIWESKEAMKAFAYQMAEHKEVIVKTRQEKWYSEDMFVRFKIIKSVGSVRGRDLCC